MQRTRSKGSHSKFAITAVALQDHISRNLSLCDPLPERHKSSQRKQKPRKPSAGNTVGQRGHHRDDGPEEKEYVLDPCPPPMTLAQKLGLADAPPAPLTVDEWSRVKWRSVDQGDSSQPCAICREEFRLQPQVLLSCSHVFHRVCLQAFERFSGRKCCPMCRKEQYQTRVIHDGARLYREKSAVRIQACWRGYVVRKWYGEVRKTVPPKDKGLRRKFFEQKFQELSDSLVRSCDTDVEEFLSAIDCELAWSRSALCQFEEQRVSETKEEDWDKIQEKAARQEARDCPICLAPLCLGTGRTEAGGRRGVLLLSCSHLFHRCCLEAFETFCLERRPVCPLCRSLYHKRLV
ncbi:RING finger protein 32 [Conger conger]|uniref:RING finger protein 32 n=1 Tax=Conger conger TaxID=82655 RepID=UPI002A5A306E|nr:RING finger protein 32 [Conger conger]XP_061096677.1 RING finger protein 32 [Conger conger]